MHRYVLLAALAALLLLPAQAGAQSSSASCDGREGVYLYEHPSFAGSCLKLTADTADQSALSFNNTTSSVRIVGAWTVTLYTDPGYGGVTLTLTADELNLGNNTIGDNTVSSARVSRAPAPGNACDGSEGVYIYEHSRYDGRCVRLTADVTDLSALAFNNIASSVRLVGAWTVTLFVDQGYGGDASAFTGDDPNLGDNPIGDNRASAVRIQRGRAESPSGHSCDGSEGVYLYELPQYGGICARFTSDSPDLRVQNFDDIASSVRLVGNYSAELARDLNYTGAISTFTADDPDLSGDAIGDNHATSLRVVRGGIPAAENRCDGGEGVYLFEHPRYQGRCIKLTAGVPDLRPYVFDDIVSSVRVVGRWRAELFRDLSATGASTAFTGDDEDLSGDAIGDNQATSVLVRRR